MIRDHAPFLREQGVQPSCQECRCNAADQVQACCVKIVAIILDLTNMKDAHAVRRQMLSLALILALQGFVGSADGVPSSSPLNICSSSSPGLLRVAMMMQQMRLRRCDCSGCFGTCLSQGAACTQLLQTLQVSRMEAIISLGPLTFRCVPHDNL